jgi:primosomal protein N' (replication factor Y)
LDKVFTYGIPQQLEEQICVGMQVVVPFGTGNRQVDAYVVELMDRCTLDETKVKEILCVSTKGIPVESELIRLAWWIKEQYGASMLQSMKTVLPVRQTIRQKQQKKIGWHIPPSERQSYMDTLHPKKNAAALRLLTALWEEEELPGQIVEEKLHVSSTTLKNLQEKGIIEIREETHYRNPLTEIWRKAEKEEGKTVVLNASQQAAVDGILGDDEKGIHKTYLIHGVTGSGKTEVYMELIAGVLATGRQVIVLIPEISLTYQTVMRFYHRFGEEVSILNSRMSAGERYDQFLRAKRGEVKVMVGPRSALFTPFSNLGMIIIDEEQEASYKSESVPRYHAVGVAKERGRMAGASVVLGSATPSVESYYEVQKGEYVLYRLPSRAVPGAVLPEVKVIDMRAELEAGNKSILSRDLANLLSDRLKKGEQSILFLNRRGYSGFISCRSCGKSIQCPHCDVSLTLHQGGRLVCHYCGYETSAPKRCPSCGSPYIAGFGIGTQKVETMVTAQFPQARILRMDADTTAKKGGHEAILSAFADEKADILIGTQMIVKGHDFPKVTLVGILAADLSLHSPTYDAAERTFDLLTQAAGRAGRGNLPGQVLIQTYSPEHYSIQTAARQDYEGFYAEEIPYRQMLHYPPVYAMMTVLFTAKDEKAAERTARACAELVSLYPVEIIGPCDAAVGKINDTYRKVIYVRHGEREKLVMIKNRLEQAAPWKEEHPEVQAQFDFAGSL